jgi:DNA (cytosine-5)-methyltransferase 1
MRYLSVCSGIEAATVAWHPLGWEAAAFSEIEPFPRAVLRHRWPNVLLHGDFTTIKGDEYGPIDLLVGGTPCQSFSLAGLRGGLADDRGNLALEFLRLARRLRPRWLVWENVPGVLSSNRGRDFGAILGGMVELGYGVAYRVLDAQYFGVPQRRRRVFVVGYLGDGRRAAAVLFECHSLQEHPPPRREAGEGAAPTIASRPSGGGGLGTDFDLDGGLIPYRAEGFDASGDGTGRGTRLVPVSFSAKDDGAAVAFAENSRAEDCRAAVAFDLRGREGGALPEGPHGTANIRSASGGSSRSYVAHPWAVRRLTPRECERLQGFPDDYTLIPYRGKPAADGPRYMALGNSMAVPVMRWIGERIDLVRAETMRVGASRSE